MLHRNKTSRRSSCGHAHTRLSKGLFSVFSGFTSSSNNRTSAATTTTSTTRREKVAKKILRGRTQRQRQHSLDGFRQGHYPAPPPRDKAPMSIGILQKETPASMMERPVHLHGRRGLPSLNTKMPPLKGVPNFSRKSPTPSPVRTKRPMFSESALTTNSSASCEVFVWLNDNGSMPVVRTPSISYYHGASLDHRNSSNTSNNIRSSHNDTYVLQPRTYGESPQKTRNTASCQPQEDGLSTIHEAPTESQPDVAWTTIPSARGYSSPTTPPVPELEDGDISPDMCSLGGPTPPTPKDTDALDLGRRKPTKSITEECEDILDNFNRAATRVEKQNTKKRRDTAKGVPIVVPHAPSMATYLRGSMAQFAHGNHYAHEPLFGPQAETPLPTTNLSDGVREKVGGHIDKRVPSIPPISPPKEDISTKGPAEPDRGRDPDIPCADQSPPPTSSVENVKVDEPTRSPMGERGGRPDRESTAMGKAAGDLDSPVVNDAPYASRHVPKSKYQWQLIEEATRKAKEATKDVRESKDTIHARKAAKNIKKFNEIRESKGTKRPVILDAKRANAPNDRFSLGPTSDSPLAVQRRRGRTHCPCQKQAPYVHSSDLPHSASVGTYAMSEMPADAASEVISKVSPPLGDRDDRASITIKNVNQDIDDILAFYSDLWDSEREELKKWKKQLEEAEEAEKEQAEKKEFVPVRKQLEKEREEADKRGDIAAFNNCERQLKLLDGMI
ncbi:uncharacterized protein BCR38DRAFT_5005 [Pseudomassariella vexata]|uniref:Uncharacterized protein n=1 Tax=Pseudomassariella vexata TaxID=1141098 RepID=A0A1Y2EHZ9_9PEZI|nr:uncharacterized protein BCR38DRAFT_5005 [Pseudomassariella vexata]ORY71188.1 hypothetical protein BCR38DRAFT_5005 [Pseudomassariella vexata]